MTRYRERDLRVEEFGSRWDRTYDPDMLVAYESRLHGLRETCEDVVGNFQGANVLQITKQFSHYPAISAKHLAWWTTEKDVLRELVHFPIEYRPGPPDPAAKYPPYTMADLNNLAWQILAKTNPSRPHVSVPTFIGELKDLPSLVRGWGSNILKNVAKGHLTWRWAVKPMIGDLRKMMGFVKAVDNRMTELYHLREGRTLKHRCQLSSATEADDHPYYIFCNSTWYSVTARLRTTYTTKVWGSAEWKPLPGTNLPQLGYDPLKQFSRRLAAGITTHEALATAWELCPWSWLIDWFGNVGDMIAATNNSIGCTWGRICLMRSSTAEATYTQVPELTDSYGTIHGWYKLRFERKERHPVYPVIPVPLPYLPVIDRKKWSILASLAILKR